MGTRSSNLSPPARADVPATGVRWRIIGLLMALSFMSWFNRLAMPAAYDEQIKQEFSLSPEAMGWVYSALLLAYAIFMTPGGWFIDRYGPKTALVWMGFGSALFVTLTGYAGWMLAAYLFVALLVIRSLMGFFSAPIYPAGARMVSHWIPFSQRAWANGLINGAAPVGMACTYVGFGYLMDWVHWQAAFVITGALTALLAAAWLVYATDFPRKHPALD
jgi:MFS transporter, ACS family, D-galactonate transporter